MKIEIIQKAGGAIASCETGNAKEMDYPPIALSLFLLAESHTGEEAEEAEKWVHESCAYRIPVECKAFYRHAFARDEKDEMKEIYGVPVIWVGGNKA